MKVSHLVSTKCHQILYYSSIHPYPSYCYIVWVNPFPLTPTKMFALLNSQQIRVEKTNYYDINNFQIRVLIKKNSFVRGIFLHISQNILQVIQRYTPTQLVTLRIFIFPHFLVVEVSFHEGSVNR